MTERPFLQPGDIWQQGQAETLPQERRAGRTRHAGARHRPPDRHRTRRGGWLALAGYGALVLVCLSVAGLAFLFVASPLDAVRDRLIERINARIGGTVAVAGPASLSFFPRTVVSFKDVAVLAPEGGKAAPVATVPSLEIEVGLWSLLLRQPQVGRLTLHRPAIALSVDAEGRRNWEIVARRTPTTTSAAAGTAGSPDAPASARPGVPPRPASAAQRIAGGSVRIVDATLHYRDERSGGQYEISALNLEVAAEDRDGPVAVEGALTWRGEQLRVSGTASPLRTILSGQPVALGLKVSGAPVDAAYAGTLTLKGGVASIGRLSFKAASARALAEWLGIVWTAGSDADALAVSAEVASGDGVVTLSSLEGSLGDATVAGSLTLDLRSRPKIGGKLQLSELDFGNLLVRWRKPRDAPAAAPPATPAAPARPEPAKERAKGWSEEAIDTHLLGVADADLALSVQRLVYKDVKAGPGTLSLIVEAGVAKAAFEAVEIYGGRGKGNLTLDGSAAALAVSADLELVGVAIEPLLRDAAGVAWLGGRGTVALTLAGRGRSERQIVEGLDGKVDLALADGVLRGIDIGKIVGAVQRGRLPSLKRSPEEHTPFSELTGSFGIAKGIARSRELKLVSTHLQLKGEGAVELGPRRIDYTLHTKIVGGPPVEGAVLKIGTLEVPVGIKGPLEAPTFTVMGHEGLGDALKQIGKNLKSRDVQDAIKGLLSGEGDKRKTRRELIEKLLRKE
jgi:AsmA protein